MTTKLQTYLYIDALRFICFFSQFSINLSSKLNYRNNKNKQVN